jgi:ubiquilin
VEIEKYNPSGLKLVFNGTVLNDDQTVESLKLNDSNFIVVLGKKTETKKKVKETKTETKVETTVPKEVSTTTTTIPSTTTTTSVPTTTTTNTSTTTSNQQNNQNLFGGLYDNSPGLEGNNDLWNNVPSPSTNEMLSNPQYQQMMLQMMQDPSFVDMLIQSNPELSQLAESNPQMRQMISSPEFLQSVLQLQGLMGNQNPNPFQGTNNNTSSSNMTTDQAKQTYAPVLTQLNDMGFTNEDLNVQAVIACRGDLNLCIDWIMNHM